MHNENRCYAVADGVAGSFVPGPWARIIARRFVERNGKFVNKEDFQTWLVDCSQQWQSWIENRWVPTMHATHASNTNPMGIGKTTGGMIYNRAHKRRSLAVRWFPTPSSTTCLHQRRSLLSAIVSFSFSAPITAAVMKSPRHFHTPTLTSSALRPDTLDTVQRTELLERAWVRRKTMNINVFSGDLIVLATDALAKWLLMRVYQNSNKWLTLLSSNSAAEFEQRVREELHNGLLEDDDLTLLVIPIA